MLLFESLDAILIAALVLMVIARRANIPYPTLLAAAGLGFASLPFTPAVHLDPKLALALFIAPALLHASYHTSPRSLRRFWFPLVALAVFAVVVTTAAVTLIGWWAGGLPLAAAFALGAIVAPPDAAAADAVLSEVGIPRRGQLLLQGESLLNDATALLLFGIAVSLGTGDAVPGSPWLLAVAAPGGIAFGAATAWVYLRVAPLFAGSLGASLADFAVTFAIWLLAERVHLSPVLAVVSFGMIVSQRRPATQPARDRIQTSAVWSAAVLVLNVVAFMLMGLQARDVLRRLDATELGPAIGLALMTVATVIAVRFAWVFAVRALELAIHRRWQADWLPKPSSPAASVVVSWSGMRGLVTLAAAFALPADFPARDPVVLAAFAVVIGTLVMQGLTLGPLIRRLPLGEDGLADKVGAGRHRLIAAGMTALDGDDSEAAQALRYRYGAAHRVIEQEDDPQAPSAFDRLHLAVLERQRACLYRMRAEGEIAEDVYRRLQEELDWSEVEARSWEENRLRAS